MNFKLSDLLAKLELLKSASAFLGQGMGKLDCSGVDVMDAAQLDALFAAIPDSWTLEELEDVVESATVCDSLANCWDAYLQGNSQAVPEPAPETAKSITYVADTPAPQYDIALIVARPPDKPISLTAQTGLDIFQLRDTVIDDYKAYVESFLNTSDPRIAEFIGDELDRGALWREPLIQLNPTYAKGGTINDLIADGTLHPDCRHFFPGFHFHDHQDRAFRCYRRNEPYVLTTGTGSGKSLSYVVPTIDFLLRQPRLENEVYAILVYPMNALINSQQGEFEKFLKNATDRGFHHKIRVASYTGQNTFKEKVDLQNKPPHVLLTNYVMLELMLSRLEERRFVESKQLQFLGLDELHTYRGRQGADVAMLIRKLRERCGRELLSIGTSATMSSEGTRTDRRATVASVASQLFGVTIVPENVIDETLSLSLDRAEPSESELADSITTPLPDEGGLAAFRNHPLSVWLEREFGLQREGDRWIRRTPMSLQDGAALLAERTGIDRNCCAERLKEMLVWSGKLEIAANGHNGDRDSAKGLNFRLHQFISQGGNIYATLEAVGDRRLTLDGQYATSGNRLLYPLVFCRDCGQEYYSVRYDREAETIVPLVGRDNSTDDEDISEGYLALDRGADRESLWSDDHVDRLPETWFKSTKRDGKQPKKEYAGFIPQDIYVYPDGRVETGAVAESADHKPQKAWFVPRPFLVCLHCGRVHSRHSNEFTKLARLSSEGRSTSTTLLCLSAVQHLQRAVQPEAAKILSFTDNRQDASLQAGHFNDFIQTSIVRSALYAAVRDRGAIDYGALPTAVMAALDLPPEEYARQVVVGGTVAQQVERTFKQVLEYRIYEDLRRGWRIVQPNLEQCGLLTIEYDGLWETCADGARWTGQSYCWASASLERRYFYAKILLDLLRRDWAISADILQPQKLDELKRNSSQYLADRWGFDPSDRLAGAAWATAARGDRVDESQSGRRDWRDQQRLVKLTDRSKFGQFLKREFELKSSDLDRVIGDLLQVLLDAGLLRSHEQHPDRLQLVAAQLIWKEADLTEVPIDPLRYRTIGDRDTTRANDYFRELYRAGTRELRQLLGREHTGQVQQRDREQRETDFRKGNLSALFCSPTMELGIDIADLNIVHMRNIPPSPANYAQRSGRAGRSGQGALVVSYASVGSGHDQYFYQRPEQMVAGVVSPPKLDLGNEDLVRSHLHSIWLQMTGVKLGDSLSEILDLEQSGENYPLRSSFAHQLQLSRTALETGITRARQILADAGCQADLRRKAWYSDDWIVIVFDRALHQFDRACDRWRTLYSEATREREEARRTLDRVSTGRATQEERSMAERRQRDAQRQLELLVQNGGPADLDFSPYRYLAAEGFLPGYNFPRLPVRAYIPSGDDGYYIARPRAIAIRELAPSNILYAEGTKYQVTRSAIVRGSDAQEQIIHVCHACGYHHAESRNHCENCKTQLQSDDHGTPSKFNVLTLDTVTTDRRNRITCDEEERLKNGYDIATYYRFAPQVPPITVTICSDDHEPLLKLSYGDTASIYRVNHGLLSNRDERGFTFDPATGLWGDRAKKLADNRKSGNLDKTTLKSEVRLKIEETSNILIVEPIALPDTNTDAFIATLQAALGQSIQAAYKLEDSELGAERLGNGRRILFWEAAEGGAGVLSQLVEDARAIQQVAEIALDICHFTEAHPKEECARACYECLLSYRNQFDHPLLDRQLVQSTLTALSNCQIVVTTSDVGTNRQQQFQSLMAQTDPQSELERTFLQAVFEAGLMLPDEAQALIPEANCKPDFLYLHDRIAIFCDGSVHDTPEQQAKDRRVRNALPFLTDTWTVFVVRYDEKLSDRIRVLEQML
jgi:superfamily II DNA/RNA helicase